jgi:hypothetical protein
MENKKNLSGTNHDYKTKGTTLSFAEQIMITRGPNHDFNRKHYFSTLEQITT